MRDVELMSDLSLVIEIAKLLHPKNKDVYPSSCGGVVIEFADRPNLKFNPMNNWNDLIPVVLDEGIGYRQSFFDGLRTGEISPYHSEKQVAVVGGEPQRALCMCLYLCLTHVERDIDDGFKFDIELKLESNEYMGIERTKTDRGLKLVVGKTGDEDKALEKSEGSNVPSLRSVPLEKHLEILANKENSFLFPSHEELAELRRIKHLFANMMRSKELKDLMHNDPDYMSRMNARDKKED